jgi:hypothetical protein
MRNAVVGMMVGVVLAIALLAMAGSGSVVHAQSDRGQAAAEDLLPVSWSMNGMAYVAIVDPRRRVLGVYEVNGTSGAIALKSVRQLHWDLQLEEFNTSTPSPREIRALVERR